MTSYIHAAHVVLLCKSLVVLNVSKYMANMSNCCFSQIVLYPRCMFLVIFMFHACTPRAQNTKIVQAVTIVSFSAIL